MSEIILCRQDAAPIAEPDRDAVRRVLLGQIDGLGEHGQRQWRRFLGWLLKLEPGELATISTKRTRSGPFHRRHMLIEQRVFQAQEQFVHFRAFRDWLKIGAGHCDWYPSPRTGGPIPIPRSISYEALEEDDMREFHMEAMRFLRSERAAAALWPGLSLHGQIDAIERVLREFEE